RYRRVRVLLQAADCALHGAAGNASGRVARVAAAAGRYAARGLQLTCPRGLQLGLKTATIDRTAGTTSEAENTQYFHQLDAEARLEGRFSRLSTYFHAAA